MARTKLTRKRGHPRERPSYRGNRLDPPTHKFNGKIGPSSNLASEMGENSQEKRKTKKRDLSHVLEERRG